ncbi:Futalosine hydrolase [Streptomyces tauricus]|uniref:futalosine hydrolase n=1 Tax=Streptomyces tauricus TaxID=68274 RepID=UPI0016751CE4|nr:futalosine hydrolase [Streptomyces tauricus]MCW8094968.1 futalosine hydrolase [Streptomyces tauricus]GHA25424.1 Futalosine hydrolase [Streptomyces tauricus]
MRVLVTTAVPAERDAVAAAFTAPGPASASAHTVPGAVLSRVALPAPSGGGDQLVLDLLAGGVGPAAAAASTAAALTAATLNGEPYDVVVSAGIGGGFQPDAPVGSLVLADEITVADLGAETTETAGAAGAAGATGTPEVPEPAHGFIPVTELGFGTVTHRPPNSLVREIAAVTGARQGSVLTVSTVTGSAARAVELRRRHPRALAEAMEGFGVAEAASAHGVPVLEIRAVSNPVGPRDRAAWRIGEALAALTGAFGKLAPVLESWNPHDLTH